MNAFIKVTARVKAGALFASLAAAAEKKSLVNLKTTQVTNDSKQLQMLNKCPLHRGVNCYTSQQLMYTQIYIRALLSAGIQRRVVWYMFTC
jgi:hypothetical protein